MVALVDRGAPAPAPRHRFAALVLAPSPATRVALAAPLRAAGVATLRAAGSMAEVRAWGRAVGTQDVCLVDGSGEPGLPRGLVPELRTAGWRRLVLLGPGRDRYAARAALAMGIRAYLVPSNGAAPRPPHARRHAAPDELSAREVQVLQQVADGHSNKDIGDELGLSALTVKSHLARIGRKLGCGDRAAMVARGFRTGLLR